MFTFPNKKYSLTEMIALADKHVFPADFFLKEQAAVEELLHKSTTKNGFNKDVYKALLPLLMVASHIEHRYSNDEQKMNNARMHAFKLTIMFGAKNHAIEYLQRFEKDYHTSHLAHQLVHDACLFQLPADNLWEVKLWQDRILYNKPCHPNALILRNAPFFYKIEQYIKSNEDTIVEGYTRQIEKTFIKKYEDDYEVSRDFDAWHTYYFEKNQRAIEKKIEFLTNKKTRENLNIAEKTLSSEQKELFIQEKEKVSPEITEAVHQEYKEQARKKYKLILQEKQEYIKQCLERDAPTIKTAAIQKYQALLSRKAPVDDLTSLARNVFYSRAAESPAAAELFFQVKLGEEQFNTWLGLTPNDDDKQIPPVFIKGSEINKLYEKYYLKKLNPADPRAGILGKFTGSCQSIGEEAHVATVRGITEPSDGFYVLCEKQGATCREDDRIVSECWAWRVGERITFDSIESQMDFLTNYPTLITDFYTFLAHKLVTQYAVERVLVGVSGQTPKQLGVIAEISPSAPVNGAGVYRDSHAQRIIADSNLPLVHFYRQLNPESLLNIDISKGIALRKEQALEWGGLCAVDSQSAFLLEWIFPYLPTSQVTEDEVRARFNLTQKWLGFVASYDAHLSPEAALKELQTFVEQGVNVNVGHRYKDALTTAARLEHWNVMFYLIEQGVNLEKTDHFGSVLHYAAQSDKNVEIVRLLLAHGASVNINNKLNGTPLHVAVQKRAIEVINILLANKADINAGGMTLETTYCNTPLTIAWQLNYSEITQLLVANGGVINIDNAVRMSITPLIKERFELKCLQSSIAAYRGSFSKKAQQQRTELSKRINECRCSYSMIEANIIPKLESLLPMGLEKLDIFAKSLVSDSLLTSFIQTNSIKIVDWLLDHISVSNIELLESAIAHQSWELVEWFIVQGADAAKALDILKSLPDYGQPPESTLFFIMQELSIKKRLQVKAFAPENDDYRCYLINVAEIENWSPDVLQQEYKTAILHCNYSLYLYRKGFPVTLLQGSDEISEEVNSLQYQMCRFSKDTLANNGDFYVIQHLTGHRIFDCKHREALYQTLTGESMDWIRRLDKLAALVRAFPEHNGDLYIKILTDNYLINDANLADLMHLFPEKEQQLRSLVSVAPPLALVKPFADSASLESDVKQPSFKHARASHTWFNNVAAKPPTTPTASPAEEHSCEL